MVSPDEIQHVRSKSECLPSECRREENISRKALGLWFLSGLKKPGFFKKANPVGFLGFIGFWVLLCFFAGVLISMSSARCYSRQINV